MTDLRDLPRSTLTAAIGWAGLVRELAGVAAWWVGVCIEDCGERVQRWARMEER